MTRRHILTLMLGAAATGMPGAARASSGNSVTMPGAVQANVVEPSAITRIDDLRFGQFFQPTANGNLRIDVDSSVTPTGGLVGLTGAVQTGTGRGPARFLVKGDPNRAFNVSIPNNIDITKGADSMRVQNFRTNVPPPRGRLNASGEFMLIVGARLQARANQAVGTYSGTFAVTVTYQ